MKGATDNVDHNPTSTTAKDSFHGTSLTSHQSRENDTQGIDRYITLDETIPRKKTIDRLPEYYTHVAQTMLPTNNPKVPPHVPSDQWNDNNATVENALEEEQRWLEKLRSNIELNQQDEYLTWSSHHSSKIYPVYSTDISALLPLFPDNAYSTAMMLHSMNIISKATQLLNPGQTPVMTCDQPLFAICKKIQWCYPDTHGEKQFVLILGGLHIELAASKMIGTNKDFFFLHNHVHFDFDDMF